MKKLFLLIFILVIAVVDIYMAKQILINIHKEELSKINNEKEMQIITETPAKEEKVEEIKKVEEVNTEKDQTQPVQTAAEENKPDAEQIKPIKQEKNDQLEEISEKNKAEKTTQIPEGYMVANVYVNLRKEPDVNSEIVAVIKKGSTVKIIGKKANHWKRVLYTSDGRVYEGWVDDRFFTIGEAQEGQ